MYKNIKKNETLGPIYQDVKDGYKKGKKKIKEKEESNKKDEKESRYKIRFSELGLVEAW